MTATAQAGLQIESDLIVQENRIELYTSDPAALDAAVARGALALSPIVRVVPVPRIGSREASIYGGLSLSGGCTSGYSVKNSSGTKGIAMAAHCSNTQSYSGTSLPYKAGNISGAYDIQWHSAPGFTVTNKIRTTTGGGTRSITATRSRANQTVGYYVCKYGKTTGYTCGYISSKSYNWDNKGSSTYIRVNNDSSSYPNLSEGGDSGGPWFNSSTAFGTHVGAPGSDANDAVYMAINYVSGISVSVMTAP